MIVGNMKEPDKYSTKDLKCAFKGVACSPCDDLSEFVKLLARIAAEKDYNALLKKSNAPYSGSKKKGPNT